MRYFRCFQGNQFGLPQPGNDIWVRDDKKRLWVCVGIQANELMATPSGPPSEVSTVVVCCRHLAELGRVLSAQPD